MKKKDFVKKIQEVLKQKTGNRPTFIEARDCLDAVVESMEQSLSEGKAIRFRGFGRFEFRKREGFTRTTHVKAGKKVPEGYETKVDPHVVAYFKPSNRLNERLTEKLGPILFDE